MPNQLRRFQQSGDLHFITFSCHDRLPYLREAQAAEIFERAIEFTRRRYLLRVYGYVVMPEHVHLIVSEPQRSSLSIALQALKTSVAKQRSQRPFWLPRSYDFNVFSEEKRIEKLKYMHGNPVARGLTATPEAWRWSSFRHYLRGEVGPVEIESNWTVGRRMGLKVTDTDNGNPDQ